MTTTATESRPQQLALLTRPASDLPTRPAALASSGRTNTATGRRPAQ